MKRRHHNLSNSTKSTTKWKVSSSPSLQLPTQTKTSISFLVTEKNVNNDSISRDFISLLAQRNMEMIVENILSHLDENSLRNCELVSTTWHSVIQSCNLWKQLYSQCSLKNKLLQTLLSKELMGSKSPVVFDSLLFKRLLKTPKNLLQIWKSGKFTSSRTNLQAEASHFYKMDSKRIVLVVYQKQLLRSESSYLIMVFNRWTMESLCTLNVPDHEKIIGLELYEELIFCSHAGGNIAVWKMSTEDPEDISMGRLNFDVPDELGMALFQLRHIHAALDFFIACFDNEVHTLISLHRIHSSANTPMKICFVATKNVPDARVLQIESDENYFVLFLQSDSQKWTKIQLRSTIDFCVIRQIEVDYFPTLPNNARFAYRSGRLITVEVEEHIGYFIKVWDAKTLTCMKCWLNGYYGQMFLTSTHLIFHHSGDLTWSVKELPPLVDAGFSGINELRYELLFDYDFENHRFSLSDFSISRARNAFNELRVCILDELQIFIVRGNVPYIMTVVNFVK